MSGVNICNIEVRKQKCPFSDPFQFEITFECLMPLPHDLDFRVIYVGSADDGMKHDQLLEDIQVGPVPMGINRFVLEAPAPQIDLIPKQDLLDVTVVLITCSYRGKDFLAVGYYVNTEYEDASLQEHPPKKPNVDKLIRSVLADKPKIKRFEINWDNPMAEDWELTPEHAEEAMRIERLIEGMADVTFAGNSTAGRDCDQTFASHDAGVSDPYANSGRLIEDAPSVVMNQQQEQVHQIQQQQLLLQQQQQQKQKQQQQSQRLQHQQFLHQHHGPAHNMTMSDVMGIDNAEDGDVGMLGAV